MSQLTDEMISAVNGTKVVNDTDEETIDFLSILVLEDTVFADIEDQDSTDIRADLLTTVGNTVKAGAILRPQGHRTMSAVTLTSGSVLLVLA
jgi:hypothetical protein